MNQLTDVQRINLTDFANSLVNQAKAHVVVPPYSTEPGFWFGGGNMIQVGDELWLVGRYRNVGDSRTGLSMGTRGLELAVFRSSNQGKTFEKQFQFSKDELSADDREVLSIEGSALRATDEGFELLVSTEKSGIGYPVEVEDYLKPGAGVWTIDVMRASSIHDLKKAKPQPAFASRDPSHLHIKDPFVYSGRATDRILACSHPFSWSSSNTVTLDESDGTFSFGILPRGFSWDVAISRGTCLLDVPKIGPFEGGDFRLMFYDGGESMRSLDEHQTAVSRPRGYSCEELGGVAVLHGDCVTRLSEFKPLFVSPFGTGCSRYVDVLATSEGFRATWQQSQEDGSQPLVSNLLDNEKALSILSRS